MKMYEYMGKSCCQIRIRPQGKGCPHPLKRRKLRQKSVMPLSNHKFYRVKRKSRGIKFTADPMKPGVCSRALGSELRGLTVDAILVEEKLKIDKEYYLSITIDRGAKCPVVLASTHGGMDIEEVPEEYIVKYHIDYSIGMMPFKTKYITSKLQLPAEEMRQFQDILANLYRMFVELDAELVEINPLVVSDGKLIAADAKVTIDDDALFRQKDLPYVEEKSDSEKKAHDLGLAYVN